jgi:hypothetical protein
VGDAPGSLGRGRGPLPRVGEVGNAVGEGRGRLLSRGLAGAGGDEWKGGEKDEKEIKKK